MSRPLGVRDSYRRHRRKTSVPPSCADCGNPVSRRSTRCHRCASLQAAQMNALVWECLYDPEHFYEGRRMKHFRMSLDYMPPGSVWVGVGCAKPYRVVECGTIMLEAA